MKLLNLQKVSNRKGHPKDATARGPSCRTKGKLHARVTQGQAFTKHTDILIRGDQPSANMLAFIHVENKVLRASWAILESCYVSRSSVYPRKMLNTQRLLARRLTVPFGIVLRELLYIWALYKTVFHLLFYIYTILLYVSAQVPLHASIWFCTREVQTEMGGVNRGAHSLLIRP